MISWVLKYKYLGGRGSLTAYVGVAAYGLVDAYALQVEIFNGCVGISLNALNAAIAHGELH